eukprot:scaffold76774_cov36-Tisochrysis_lutea.AAC.1
MEHCSHNCYEASLPRLCAHLALIASIDLICTSIASRVQILARCVVYTVYPHPLRACACIISNEASASVLLDAALYVVYITRICHVVDGRHVITRYASVFYKLTNIKHTPK